MSAALSLHASGGYSPDELLEMQPGLLLPGLQIGRVEPPFAVQTRSQRRGFARGRRQARQHLRVGPLGPVAGRGHVMRGRIGANAVVHQGLRMHEQTTGVDHGNVVEQQVFGEIELFIPGVGDAIAAVHRAEPTVDQQAVLRREVSVFWQYRGQLRRAWRVEGGDRHAANRGAVGYGQREQGGGAAGQPEIVRIQKRDEIAAGAIQSDIARCRRPCRDASCRGGKALQSLSAGSGEVVGIVGAVIRNHDDFEGEPVWLLLRRQRIQRIADEGVRPMGGNDDGKAHRRVEGSGLKRVVRFHYKLRTQPTGCGLCRPQQIDTPLTLFPGPACRRPHTPCSTRLF